MSKRKIRDFQIASEATNRCLRFRVLQSLYCEGSNKRLLEASSLAIFYLYIKKEGTEVPSRNPEWILLREDIIHTEDTIILIRAVSSKTISRR